MALPVCTLIIIIVAVAETAATATIVVAKRRAPRFDRVPSVVEARASVGATNPFLHLRARLRIARDTADKRRRRRRRRRQWRQRARVHKHTQTSLMVCGERARALKEAPKTRAATDKLARERVPTHRRARLVALKQR